MTARPHDRIQQDIVALPHCKPVVFRVHDQIEITIFTVTKHVLEPLVFFFKLRYLLLQMPDFIAQHIDRRGWSRIFCPCKWRKQNNDHDY
jgi:hypothetical protein